MPTSCCPSCRLLASGNTTSCSHCGHFTISPAKLATPKISGVTAITKQPAKGWRDFVALLATAFGVFGGMIGGAFLVGPVGLLGGLVVGTLGYTKQFWRTALARRDRVVPIDRPRPPAGGPIVGIAQPHEGHLELANTPANTLAVASTIGLDGGVIARHIAAVPFWLVVDGQRILIDGSLWLASARPERLSSITANEVLKGAGISLTRAERKRISLSRTVLAAGDRIAAIGAIAPEQLLGSGYRDHLVEAMRGEPGRPVWLERLDPNIVDPD